MTTLMLSRAQLVLSKSTASAMSATRIAVFRYTTTPTMPILSPFRTSLVSPLRSNYGNHIISSKRLFSDSSSTSSTVKAAATEATSKLSKIKQYAEQFKNKPASHLIAFGLLHEVTAVVPLPIVYFTLAETGMKIPFPEQAMEEGNKFVARVAKYYGWDLEGSEGARTMLNMATSYALVKAFMPLRLALCVWMTPWTATRIVSPVINVWRRFKK